jgi:hypothetical protein
MIYISEWFVAFFSNCARSVWILAATTTTKRQMESRTENGEQKLQ